MDFLLITTLWWKMIKFRVSFIQFLACQTAVLLIRIEQTKLRIKFKLREHKLYIKYIELNLTALCEHSMTINHVLNWENTVNIKIKTD